MGVELSQYRAVIGRFAAHAHRLKKTKGLKKTKLSKSQNVTEGEGEKVTTCPALNNKFDKSWGSLDRWKTRSQSRDPKIRSKPFSPQPVGRSSKNRIAEEMNYSW